jgi:hypothetical protein
MAEAMSVVRPHIVLDERMGGGGWFEPAFSILFGSTFAKTDAARAEMIPALEGGDLETILPAMRSCFPAYGNGYNCGFFEEWTYDPTIAASSANDAASKVAVMMGLDVSGNDFLTRLVVQRSGTTRTFGVVPGLGGYGRIQLLPTLGVALATGSVQTQDSLFVVDDADPARVFESSSGVVPDEIVFEKQSDAIVGRDTLYEAAIAWVQAP